MCSKSPGAPEMIQSASASSLFLISRPSSGAALHTSWAPSRMFLQPCTIDRHWEGFELISSWVIRIPVAFTPQSMHSRSRVEKLPEFWLFIVLGRLVVVVGRLLVVLGRLVVVLGRLVVGAESSLESQPITVPITATTNTPVSAHLNNCFNLVTFFLDRFRALSGKTFPIVLVLCRILLPPQCPRQCCGHLGCGSEHREHYYWRDTAASVLCDPRRMLDHRRRPVPPEEASLPTRRRPRWHPRGSPLPRRSGPRSCSPAARSAGPNPPV